jgi:Flp pilus assembly protein TadG
MSEVAAWALVAAVLLAGMYGAEALGRIAAAISRAATALEDSNRIRALEHQDERALADVARTAIRTYEETKTLEGDPAPVLRFERSRRPDPPEENPPA